jgi:hypothetical protein
MFSLHAAERVMYRVAGLCTAAEVISAVKAAGPFPLGETAVVVKRLDRVMTVRTADGSVSKGDLVIAVYSKRDKNDAGCIATVQLRGSKQKVSPRWVKLVDRTMLSK